MPLEDSEIYGITCDNIAYNTSKIFTTNLDESIMLDGKEVFAKDDIVEITKKAFSKTMLQTWEKRRCCNDIMM